MTTKNKLNILQFICPTGFYGAERWILALAHHLPKDSACCELAVTLEDNSRELELVKKYRQEYGEAYELPMSNRFDLSVINKLVALIKEKNIDIIHTHGYKSDIIGVIAARKAGVKCVVTPHGFENAKDLKLKFFVWMGCKAMSYADAVVPLSPQLIDDTKQLGVSENKIVYIQNGVDLSEVEAQRNKDNPVKSTTEKRVGFIGQMISRKNIIDVLDIFDELATEHETLQLILVGDGDQRVKLETYSKKLKNNHKINFLGFRNDRLELLQSFDLFVMTSTLEGIPRCLMEAFAMGIPVAAYNIPGIDQLITHDETGLLASQGDKETLKTYWEKLLFNKSVAQALADNARQFVHLHYSAKRMADEYMDLYKRLTKN